MIHRNDIFDMSPQAVEQRLRDLSELYELGMVLRSARYIGKVDELRRQRKIGAEQQASETVSGEPRQP